jgi:hypothetical protein
MKRIGVIWALTLALLRCGAAEPAHRALVLKADGAVSQGGKAVLTGQVLDEGSKLNLEAKSRLTLLLLDRGQRLEIRGKGWLLVGPKDLQLSGGLKQFILDSNQQKLALTGDNKRNVGGMTLRQAASLMLKDSAFDRIEVRDGSAGLVFSCAAGQGQPPELTFQFLSEYSVPDWDGAKPEIRRPDTEAIILASSVGGERQGARWRWEVAWPQSDDQRMGLLVTDSAGSPWLYTMVYQTNPTEENELSQARRRAAEWSKREPQSVQPLLIYASLLENRGRLEEAHQQLRLALALAGHDAGLRAMQARILCELGRFSQAAGFK